MKKQAIRMVFLGLAVVVAAASQAQTYSSRAGAAYTLYLDFTGFTYSGTWGGGTPGTTNAWGTQAQRKEVWARTAEKYAPFGINVTTLDPAIAAGQNGSDAARQSYYNTTAKMMHTVIGSGTWYGAAGGVSYVGVTPYAYAATVPYHTNWVFTNYLGPDGPSYISEATGHENGHGLGLSHQRDTAGLPGAQSGYSSNGGATGNGSYAPMMGNSYSSQRGTLRLGPVGTGASVQNDVTVIAGDPGMVIPDDNVGHTLGTATSINTGLPGGVLGQGIIAPVSTGGVFNPMGVSNYTSDFFSFTAGGGAMSMSLFDGSNYITAGVADPGATFRGTLKIYDSQGVLVGTSSSAANTMSETFSGSLAAGNYFARVDSIGGYASTYDSAAKYYTMGSYFIKGSNVSAAPEPATFAFLGLGLVAIIKRRRK